ncbi:MAG: hypothetical protein H0V92_10550 [Pseudonocardiales bacterium]|nr:hypothetical protein [Pseudonocardiales bacterium]
MARRGSYAIISVIRVIGLIIVAFLVVHILFVVFDANQDNPFASFVGTGAHLVAFGLDRPPLFPRPENLKLEAGIDFGIAALIWLVITNIVTGLVRRVG